MAATLTDSGELTYVSFPIEKTETTDDGDLVVFGKCSDGAVDHDQQVVLPSFTAKAAAAWLESGGNVRVQHNAQRDPAGIGIEVKHDGDATWLRSLVIEPVAKRLVAKGALRAYSVGIARPTIERDPTGKARGGIISGGEIVEISLVDRPANARCGISLVKSADDGTPEYVGKVFGDGEDIAKALGGEVVIKSGVTYQGEVVEKAADTPAEAQAPAPGTAGISNFQMPDLNLTITPNDMMRMVQQKFVSQHYDELAVKAVADAEAEVLGKDHREFSADQRREQASAGNALPDGSYPIPDKDALRRAAILARSGHGNVAAARRLIARRARELGVANPLDESDAEKVTKTETGIDLTPMPQPPVPAPETIKEAEPDLTKSCSKCAAGDCDGAACPCGKCTDGKCACGKSAGKAAEPEQKPKPVKKAKKKPKKLPPWLNKPADGDGDGDGDSSKSAEPETCKHAWEITDQVTGSVACSKCHTPPSVAAGVTAAPMDPAPVGELMESNAPVSAKGATPQSASGAKDAPAMKPVPRHREPDGAETEAFEKDSGMSDGDNEAPTRLEAPTLKTSPEVSALMRFKAIGIDPELGKLHDLTCPAYHPDEVAKYHPFADLATLIDEGAWQRKAVEAACGPIEHALKMHALAEAAQALKAADPGMVNDWRLEAHKAFRDANPGPGTYPTPGSVSAQRYCRPVLTEGRAANSPGYGAPNTSPQVATGAPNASHFDRPPLSGAHASPSPSFMKGGFAYPSEQGVPTQLTYARQQQEAAHEALSLMHTHLGSMFPQVCPMDLNDPGPSAKHPVPATAGIGKGVGTAPEAPAAALKATPEDAGLFAGAGVHKGFKKMRKKLGKKVLSGKMTVDEARAKMGRQFAQKGAEAVQKSAGAPVMGQTVTIKAGQPPAYSEMSLNPVATNLAAPVDPEVIKSAVAEATADLKDLLVKQQETFTTKLAEQQRVIDAIADQPDPSTAAFSGLAFNPLRKSARPAGVTEIAEAAARAQRATMRELENLYNSSSDPAAREAYYATLTKMQGGATP